MAKKKSKKDSKKKDLKKKDLKKKDLKRKKLKKKKLKKKEFEGKKLKGKEKKKDNIRKVTGKTDSKVESGAPASVVAGYSTNYNVKDALSKLRSLKNSEEVDLFTRGEERVTILRAIPAVKKRVAK